MAVGVKYTEEELRRNAQIVDADFKNSGFDNKYRGPNSGGIYGEKIKFTVDRNNPADAYKALNRREGLIDLTKSTAWGINPEYSKQDLVSYKIRLHQPKNSSIITNIFTNLTQLFQYAEQNVNDENNSNWSSTVVLNPYANQVLADDLNWTIKIPLLSLLPLDFTTNFGSGENEGSNIFGDVSRAVANFYQNSPLAKGGIGGKSKGALPNVLLTAFGANAGGMANSLIRTLYPSVSATQSSDRFYRGSNNISYPMAFELLNTIDEETTKFNIEFVRLLSYLTSASSRNKIIEDSPVVGEAEIAGLRYIPLIKLDFQYEGKGNFLYIDGEPIPEAYSCTLNVSEMLPHYRNLQHHYIHRGEKLRAINNDEKALCNAIRRGIEAGSNVFGSFFP